MWIDDRGGEFDPKPVISAARSEKMLLLPCLVSLVVVFLLLRIFSGSINCFKGLSLAHSTQSLVLHDSASHLTYKYD